MKKTLIFTPKKSIDTVEFGKSKDEVIDTLESWGIKIDEETKTDGIPSLYVEEYKMTFRFEDSGLNHIDLFIEDQLGYSIQYKDLTLNFSSFESLKEQALKLGEIYQDDEGYLISFELGMLFIDNEGELEIGFFCQEAEQWFKDNSTRV